MTMLSISKVATLSLASRRGLLTFLDPLKDDAKISVARLHEIGVLITNYYDVLRKNTFLFLAVSSFPQYNCNQLPRYSLYR